MLIYIDNITIYPLLLQPCLHIYIDLELAFYNFSPYICNIKGNKYEYSPEAVSRCRKHLSVPIR